MDKLREDVVDFLNSMNIRAVSSLLLFFAVIVPMVVNSISTVRIEAQEAKIEQIEAQNKQLRQQMEVINVKINASFAVTDSLFTVINQQKQNYEKLDNSYLHSLSNAQLRAIITQK